MRHLLDGLVRDPALEQRLARHYPGTIYAFLRVPSTMDVAHQAAADGAPEGALIFAARQEQGRGRLGRRWESPEGGVYCSLILRPTRPPVEIPQLSLVAGLAVAETIRELTPLSPAICWPNDVFVKGRKLAGILVESRTQDTGPRGQGKEHRYVVIGIGVNVNSAPAALARQAASLADCGVDEIDPCDLAGRLCRRVRAWYDVWSAQGFSPIRDAVRPLIGLFGQVVRLTAGSERLEGTASDIDESGRLVVRLDSGILRAFDMGEITLLR